MNEGDGQLVFDLTKEERKSQAGALILDLGGVTDSDEEEAEAAAGATPSVKGSAPGGSASTSEARAYKADAPSAAGDDAGNELQRRLAKLRQKAGGAESKPESWAAAGPPASGSNQDQSGQSELQKRLAAQRQRAEEAAKGGKVTSETKGGRVESACSMSELQRKLADANARTNLLPPSSAPQSLAPGRGSMVPRGSVFRGMPSAAGSSLGPAQADAGPPFHSRAYLDSMMEKSELVFNRFTNDVLKKYGADRDGGLSATELLALACGLHEVLGLPAPVERTVTELRDRVNGGPCERITRELFKPFFEDLMRKAKFRAKIGKAGVAFQAVPEQEQRPGVPSECEELPIGTAVELVGYKYCHPSFAEGAKKLRLKRFVADDDRLPLRSGLTVAGSYLHHGAARGSVKPGTFVVGVQDEDGQDHVVDARGLALSAVDPDADKESWARARNEAATVGQCLTVRTRLRQFEAEAAELRPRALTRDDARRRSTLAPPVDFS